ncbi:MAG: hypothetical protein ACI9KE_005744 [Polyangiales bacterium]|jgi:hypothetical protein
MARDLLDRLYERMEEDVDGLARLPEGLRAVVDARYDEVTVCIDHDPVAEMIRVSVAVAAPAGSGRSFLVWCLATNAMYWDVKLGLDGAGRLLVHSDLDAHRGLDIDELCASVLERADTVVDLLDDDFVEWMLEHRLGTPTQHQRWTSRPTDDD